MGYNESVLAVLGTSIVRRNTSKNRRRALPSDCRGVSLLLEVVVGLGIFATCILLIFGVFTSSQKATASSKDLTVASDLAREIMESQLARGYAGLETTDPVVVTIPTTVDGRRTTTPFTTKVDVTRQTADANFPFRRKYLLVTVSWDGATGVRRKVKLETYVLE